MAIQWLPSGWGQGPIVALGDSLANSFDTTFGIQSQTPTADSILGPGNGLADSSDPGSGPNWWGIAIVAIIGLGLIAVLLHEVEAF